MSDRAHQVLIIEDNLADAKYLEALLSDPAAPESEVTKASTLASAMAAFAAGPASGGWFDVALLDLGLPDSESIQTLRAVLAHSPKTAIVVLSGLSDQRLALQAVREGAEDYLVKGRFDADSLARSVRHAVERKRTQLALSEGQVRLKLALEGADLGTWDWNVVTGEVAFNDRWSRMLGFEPSEVGNHVSGWEQLIHPDDRAHVMSVLKEHLEGRTPTYESEHRLRSKSGAWVWVLDRGAVMERAGDGAPLRAAGTHLDITERKAAQERLEESRVRMTSVINSAMDAIITADASQRVVLFNPAAERMFQSSAADAVGRDINEFLPERFRAVHRSHIETFGATGVTTRRMGDSASLWGRRRDGSEFPIEASVSHTTAAGQQLFTVILRDITERRAAEALVRESEARYRAVVEDQTELICRFRPDGTLTFVNGAFCREHARSREELIGTNILDHTPEEQRGAVRARLASLAQGEPPRTYEEVTVRSGQQRWHLWLDRVVATANGTPSEIQAIGRDITAQRAAEVALRASEEQLRQSQKMEAVGMLASGVAHDFNNLLTAIRGYASLARKSLEHDHPALEALDQVEEASRQATGVASALLTFARKAHTEKTPVQVAVAVETAVRLFRRTLPPAIRLNVDTSRAASLWTLADITQLQQVVMNLGINARDAIEGPGSISITVAPDQGDPEGRLCISVSDTGTGISEEIRSRIFEPFFTTKPRGRGTGLGLAVIHGIVQDHGGAITLEPAPGKGSTFHVFLPRIPAPTSGDLDAEGGDAGAGKGGLVLLAEHNHLVRGLLASMLATLGYEVAQVTNSAELLEAVGSSDRPIEMLVIAFNLPDEPFAALFERVRGLRRVDRFIVVAGSDTPDPVAGRHGAVVLRKPFQLADLRRAIATLHAESAIGGPS